MQIVVSDGLNALAVTDEDHLSKLLHELRLQMAELGLQVAPEVFVYDRGESELGIASVKWSMVQHPMNA